MSNCPPGYQWIENFETERCPPGYVWDFLPGYLNRCARCIPAPVRTPVSPFEPGAPVAPPPDPGFFTRPGGALGAAIAAPRPSATPRYPLPPPRQRPPVFQQPPPGSVTAPPPPYQAPAAPPIAIPLPPGGLGSAVAPPPPYQGPGPTTVPFPEPAPGPTLPVGAPEPTVAAAPSFVAELATLAFLTAPAWGVFLLYRTR